MKAGNVIDTQEHADELKSAECPPFDLPSETVGVQDGRILVRRIHHALISKRKQSGPENRPRILSPIYKKAVPRFQSFRKIIHASTAIDSNAVEMSGFISRSLHLIFGLFSLGARRRRKRCIDAILATHRGMAPSGAGCSTPRTICGCWRRSSGLFR